MNRRDFLITAGTTAVLAGCVGGGDNSTPQNTTTPKPTKTPSPTMDLINVTDHHFEKFAVDDVNAFVTVENISDRELNVRIDISLFEDNMRVSHAELAMVRDLPPGIAEERSNITLTDVKGNNITHYRLEMRACDSDSFKCGEVEPHVLKFDGGEYQDRLEGEWIDE